MSAETRLVLCAVLAVLALAIPDSALAAPGGLTQSSSPFACFSSDAIAGCTAARSLRATPAVAVSPDGRFVYVVDDGDLALSPVNGSITVFARDTATGNLTELAGAAGCFTQDGSDGLAGSTCTAAKGLRGAKAVSVSPDGLSLYVGASGTIGPPANVAVDTIAIFKRDVATGALIQPAGPAGCLTDAAAGTDPDCTAIAGPLKDIRQLVTSPDNAFVYAAVPEDPAMANDGAVLAFARNASTSALTRLSGATGCISNTVAGCTVGRALREPNSLAVSPDGKQLYVAASEGRAGVAGTGALVILNRNAATGILAQPPGVAGCLNASGDDGSGLATCALSTTGQSLFDANSIVVAPDGKNVYLAAQGTSGNAALNFGTLNVFGRDTTTGAISQPGVDSCFSQDGSDGGGVAGVCTVARGMHEPTGVAIAPDGSTVYLASSDTPTAISTFSRNATSGRLSQLAGGDGCISPGGADGATPDGASCRVSVGVQGASDLAVTTAGVCSVYSANDDSSSLASFRCDPPVVPAPTPDPTPTPTPTSPSATPATPVPVKPVLPAPLSASKVFVLKSAKACLSKRAFSIRVRLPAGVTAASLTVLVGRKRVKRVTGSKLKAPVDLRGLPKGTFTVSVTLKTTDGRTVKATRRYRTCAKKKRRT